VGAILLYQPNPIGTSGLAFSGDAVLR